jgi:valine--pyruvate aminotransferase
MLFNILAGVMPDGSRRSIHLPLAPEYLGYADVGLCDNFFTATRPDIELLDDHIFKYRLNYSRLEVDEQTAALCVSRPTNPTGNVLTDEEIEHLDDIARRRGIPLIIDGAYGLPFPNITFTDARPHWNENTALLLSLSKLGLPGARTGIVIANEELVQACTHGNTIASLASGTLGPAIATELFRSGDILPLTENYVRPFYRHRSQQTLQWFRDALGDLPYQIHKPEGAIFLWLWFEGLPISSQELYQRLKKRGVLVVSGHNFFIGLDDDWPHRNECLRVSYAMNEDSVKRGVEIIAEEVRAAWSDASA